MAIRYRLALLCIGLATAISAQAQSMLAELNITLGEQRVRFAPTRSFQQMQLEVVNSVGEVVLTHTTTEAEYDWNLRAGNDEVLVAGLYTYRLTLKFSEETTHQHRGHFIVEEGQGRIWLTAQDGAEVSGTTLNATRSGVRSLAGFRTAEEKQPQRDMSGREIVDQRGNKLTEGKDGKKSVKQEKAGVLATGNQLAKFAADGVTLIDSAATESGGNVGIGTTFPNTKLSVSANNVAPPSEVGIIGYFANANESNTFITADSYGNGNVHSDFLFRRARGTMAAPLAVQANDIIGQIQARGYGATGFATTARAGIRMTAAQNWTDTAQGAYLAFMTNPNNSAAINVERMRITDAGDVGIGVTAPRAKLDVDGDVLVGVGVAPSIVNNTSNLYLGNTEGASYNNFRLDGYQNNLYVVARSDYSFPFGGEGAGIVFRTGTGGSEKEVDRMRITPSGYVAIGTQTAPQSVLDVTSSQDGIAAIRGRSDRGTGVLGRTGDDRGVAGIAITSGTGVYGSSDSGFGVYGYSATNYAGYFQGPVFGSSFNTPSDQRYKQSVQPLAQSLNKLVQLRGVSYEWKRSEFPQMNFAEGRYNGLLAQEVEKVFPEMVKQDSEGMYSVSYLSLIPVLVEAIKEQDQKAAAALAIKDKQLASQAQLLAALQKRLATVERVIVRKARKRK